MTSESIYKVCDEIDKQWFSSKGTLLNTTMPVKVKAYRATLEVAFQLALLNEGMDRITDLRNPHLRVMVEPGNYPIVTEARR